MYAATARLSGSHFRADSPLTNEQIARYAPSVLASEAHSSRGERYAFIPTINVIDGLRREGFEPYSVSQTKVRDSSRREFTKHLVRLRHAHQIQARKVGEEIPELVLVNSHDGTSSYQLMAGFFRLVCSNGLIVGDTNSEIRVRHSGNVVHDVIEGATRIIDDIKFIEDRVDQYKSIELDRGEQHALAEAALQLRWEAGLNPVRADQILQARRWDDRKDDLWTTFNRVQENLIQGGVMGRSSTGRRMTTRAVGGVNENVKLNRALWTLADTLAKFKTGEQAVEQYEQAYAA